ncbi:hypothetical protein [Mycobacteroides abscessus]|uniref:hypothetical protein n=1 Tax=Mycobacteroides abscessus TaxID=36809 RepID=UPI000C25A7EC|nr:hypothetical protein [Mycobacteroides abscessus]RIR61363.1 hypothetical protein D2E62_23455 [Mycobacteroides abscessus]
MTDIGVGDSPHIMSVIRTAPTQLGDIDVGDRFGRASVIQSEGTHLSAPMPAVRIFTSRLQPSEKN